MLGVVLYGSQLLRASPSAESAWDLVVIVDRYGSFHRALAESGLMRRPVWALNVLGHVLPPSITALVPEDEGPIGKCAIVSLEHFRRALAPRSPDHFLKGRMVQRVGLLWSRDEATATAIEGWIRTARRDVLNWAGPWLPEPFDARTVPRRMLQVSYGGELRPESGGRADEIYEAQAAWLTRAYAEVLEAAAADGTLVRVPRTELRRDPDTVPAELAPESSDIAPYPGDLVRYRFAVRPGRWDRFRTRLYFLRSKIRATLRWGKHVVTFNDWLGYLVRKVERRTGEKLELTRLERRLPLVFLWPRAFRFFLSGTHRRRRDAAEGHPGDAESGTDPSSPDDGSIP